MSAPRPGRIAARMAQAAAEGRPALVAYVCAGDPDLETTFAVVRALEAAGAGVVELGVPFSDPVADGPVVQQAAMRALRAGTRLGDVLDLVGRLRDAGCTVPILLFGYLNPMLARGLDVVAAQAARRGVDGLLVVDLPVEHAARHLAAAWDLGLDTVLLASPTTRPERLARIAEASTGFVYWISRLGVTGDDRAPATDLARRVAAVRQQVGRPVATGFGIGRPEQVAALRGACEGVVVGSAFVRRIAAGPPSGAARRAAELARRLVAAAHGHDEGDERC